MATFTAVLHDELASFLSAYALRLRAVGGIPAGSVNSNYWIDVDQPDGSRTRLFLRLYEEQGLDGARAEATMLDALAASGVPTPAPLRTVGVAGGGEAIGVLSGKPAAVFPWRPGDIRCQASVTAGDVRQVGESLARVHRAAVAGLHRGPGRFRREDLALRLERVGASADPTLRALAGPLGAQLASVDESRDRTIPTGLVHGDLFRDNVLFEPGGRISALLDFESAFEGAYLFDLAVCVLAWTYGDDLDLTLARTMVAGYTSVRPISPSERLAFFEEARFAALRFTITRITDFAMKTSSESAPRVMKDYRRFLARFDRLTALGRDGLVGAIFEEPPAS